MTLDATIGGPSSNSYILLADAIAYFSTRLYVTNWSAADSATQEAALITATRRIDEEDFEGARASFTQALKWPRTWVPFNDASSGVYAFSSYYPPDTIPQPVKDATCEMALYLLTGDTLAESDLQNFKRIKVGAIELEMNMPQQSGKIPANAMRMLRHLIKSSARVTRS